MVIRGELLCGTGTVVIVDGGYRKHWLQGTVVTVDGGYRGHWLQGTVATANSRYVGWGHGGKRQIIL